MLALQKLLVLFFFLVPQGFLTAQNSSTDKIVSIVSADRVSHVGAVLRENDTHVEIYDIALGKKFTFEKKSIKDLRRDLSSQAIIGIVTPPKYLAWKVKNSIPSAKNKGVIAEVDAGVFYGTLGKSHGVEVGNELNVFRIGGEILDPKTGNVLGIKRQLIAKTKVVQVEEKLSKSKLIGDLEVALKVGDVIESNINNSVAVLPLADNDGNAGGEINRFTEQVITAMSKRGVPVVERKLLGKVIRELAMQNSPVFDETQAQAIGKQLGAFALLTGSISAKGKYYIVNMRLIRVTTGKVLFTTTFNIRESEGSTSSSAKLEGLIVGKFDVFWTELSTRKKGVVEYEFEANRTIKKAGKKIGTWKPDNGTIVVNFFDVERGKTVISPSSRTRFTGKHFWKNGNKSNWVGKRKR